MVWKVNEETKSLAQDSNGNPVWVSESDGKEFNVDYLQMRKQIVELTEKAKDRKEELESVKSQLEGIEDVAGFIKQARLNEAKLKALGTGSQDDLILAATKPLKDEIDARKKSFDDLLAENSKLKTSNETRLVFEAISGSKYVSERITNAIVFRDLFINRFKVDGGKIVGLDGEGKVIRDDTGEVANFEVAAKKIVDAYAGKDTILKGSVLPGSGANAVNLGGVDFSKMNKTEQMAYAKAHPEALDTIKKLT